MGRPATATIDLAAIKHNYDIAKRLSPQGGKAMAIIKANAYGHGAVQVAHYLEDHVDAFGVACIEEAVELRDAGITKAILLLEGFFSTDELDYIRHHNLWCALHDEQQIAALAALKPGLKINIWLKMDSGMHRLGIAPENYAKAYERLRGLDVVDEIVMMSHFSSADELGLTKTRQQIESFDQATKGIDAPISIANSAGVLAHDDARRHWQRPGIMLYGSSPFEGGQENADHLKPTMMLTSEIIAVRSLQAGDAVGYGERWVCDKSTIVGTVAMGYADGYPRHCVDGTPVMVDGVRTRVIGRVSMDMMTVDLSNVPTAKIGSAVELWGAHVSVNDVAACAQTISYTLFTGITKRVHKCYI
ncbi:MAG: alanine racemase [Methylocystaceae bacterium]|nr:alanine racemase [Methylocystaceae bacterium]